MSWPTNYFSWGGRRRTSSGLVVQGAGLFKIEKVLKVRPGLIWIFCCCCLNLAFSFVFNIFVNYGCFCGCSPQKHSGAFRPPPSTIVQIQVPRPLPLFNATIPRFIKKSINSALMGTAIIPLSMPGPVGPTTWMLFLLVRQIQNLARLLQKFSNTNKFFLRNKSKNPSKGAWNNSFF